MPDQGEAVDVFLPSCGEPLAQLPVQWRGTKTTRRDFAAIRGIDLNISRDELDRRIRAFNEHFKAEPALHPQPCVSF